MNPNSDDASLAFVVSGHHMSGLSRGHELPQLGAQRVGITATAAEYRFYALGTQPPKPALVHLPGHPGTASIEVEEWRLQVAGLGRLVAALASPQAIGRIRLVDGRSVHGFVVQAGALRDAVDITACGSWRRYLATSAAMSAATPADTTPGLPADTSSGAPGSGGGDPEVVQQVQAASAAYEQALTAHDLDRVAGWFWHSERVVRFGPRENLYGHAAIDAFRRAQPATLPPRAPQRCVINAFGRDFATCSIEDRRDGGARIGRTSQAWVRLPEGWRIVAAHVSVVPAEGP